MNRKNHASSGKRTVNSLEIAIVIPTLEEETRVARAVDAARTCRADEVVVIDGGSRDATCRLAREAGARVVTSEAGRGIQQAVGVRMTDTQVILFQHADNWLSADAVDQVRHAMRNTGVPMGAFQQD